MRLDMRLSVCTIVCVVLMPILCSCRPVSVSSLLTGTPDYARHIRKHECHLSLGNHDSCGIWQQDYTLMHRDIIAGQRPPRYLTVDGYTGLADRLVTAVSGLALAILTDRAFVLTRYLNRNKASLDEVFCSPFIQWSHTPPNSNMTTVDCHWEKDETELQKPCTFGKEKVIDVDFEEAFGDVELVQIFAQNGLLSWLFARPKYADHLTSIGLTKDNAYSCLSNFIFQAAPKLQAQLPRPVLQALQDNIVIGIQIRLGDEVLQEPNATSLDWKAIMDPWSSCALELEESLGILARAVRWFLVTDSVQLRSFFEQSYGDKVLTGTPERVAHSRDQTAGALSSAAVDNWLLGMTPMKVISEQSSFGRSAALRLNGNASVFTVQQFNSFEQMSDQRQVRVARGVSRECRPEHPDNIEDLLRAWWWV